MSTSKPTAWHEGHEAGYQAALDDVAEHVDRTIREWYAMKIVTADQMVALQWLHRDLERQSERRATER